LARTTSYEAPHYAVISNFQSLHLSSAQIFFSAPVINTVITILNFNETEVFDFPKISEINKYHNNIEDINKTERNCEHDQR
jgi:hypothetical protein